MWIPSPLLSLRERSPQDVGGEGTGEGARRAGEGAGLVPD